MGCLFVFCLFSRKFCCFDFQIVVFLKVHFLTTLKMSTSSFKSGLGDICLLFVKNVRIHYRHKLACIVEILLPTLLVLILALFRAKNADVKVFEQATLFDEFDFENITFDQNADYKNFMEYIVLYSPANDDTNRTMSIMERNLDDRFTFSSKCYFLSVSLSLNFQICQLIFVGFSKTF